MKIMVKAIEVKIPLTPNFIMVGTQNTSIDKFTDEELAAIGKEWTENLIKKARANRKK